MTKARIAMLLAGTALLGGWADSKAPSAPAAGQPAAATTAARVDNFLLVDQNLVAHELHRFGDAPAVVLVSQTLGDAATAAHSDQLAADYGAKGVEVWALDSSPKDTLAALQAETAK